jgi:hypothetical protein
VANTVNGFSDAGNSLEAKAFQGGSFMLESPCDEEYGNSGAMDLSVIEQGQAIAPPDLINLNQNFNQHPSSSIMDEESPINSGPGGLRARSANDDDANQGNGNNSHNSNFKSNSGAPAGKQIWSGGSGGGAMLSDDE